MFLPKVPSKTTLYIIIAVVVLGLFIFIYFIGRRSAKINVEQVTLPSDQPGGYKLSPQEVEYVNQTAQALHRDMDGINWSHDDQPYQNFLSSSDTVFVAIYNQFNKLFSNENEGTLREWLESEVGGSWNPQFNKIRMFIIERMDRLNLR